MVKTGTMNPSWHVETPCTNRMIDADDPLNSEPCEVEEWIRINGTEVARAAISTYLRLTSTPTSNASPLHFPRAETMLDEEATIEADEDVSIEVMVCDHCFHLVYPEGLDDYCDPDVLWPCPTARTLARSNASGERADRKSGPSSEESRPEAVLTPIERRIRAIQERVDRVEERMPKVARDDFEWLLFAVREMHRGLTTAYWMVHGSESGREWDGREAFERCIRDVLGQFDG